VKRKLVKLAQGLGDSPFDSIDKEEIRLEDGHVVAGDIRMPIPEVLRRAKSKGITCKSLAIPQLLKRRKVTCKTHSAVFAEVSVDADFGTVHVTRVVCAVAAGRILNPKTARSQIIGGVVWGIGMALHEESYLDPESGRFINHDFAGYHIPVNADIGEIEVIFVEEEDEVVNPLGVKGVGEIGIVGTPAAIANAIFHATGKRVRSLPITPDKLL
jgi:xanthine dehydrogenase YagR molybdenum-binding subunit